MMTTDEGSITQVPIPTPENPFRTAQYIAESMGVKSYTVQEWLRNGKLKGYSIDGKWKVLHSDFVEFLQVRYGPGVQGPR
jgi:hypothetical protein